MKREYFRVGIVENNNSIAFEFDTYAKTTDFIRTVLGCTTRPNDCSVVITRMTKEVEEVGLNE